MKTEFLTRGFFYDEVEKIEKTLKADFTSWTALIEKEYESTWKASERRKQTIKQ
jgi:hypothetical protein